MKATLFFIFFFSITSFGQTNHNVKQQLKTCQDSLQVKQQIILDLAEELQLAKSNGQVTSELLEKMRAENEKLREIMIDYIKQIDNDQIKIAQLEAELDKCQGN